METQAEALNQLTTDELEGKFKILEGTTIEDDLAELKKEQSVISKSKQKGELPPGRTAVPSNMPFPFRESEIERELSELRRRDE
ncbi:hypothetical protein Patl1_23985 [Pistacia atlantica]|uniref:Uncharacterized protein n=1 Tax=Pistacia atlantica TaxID=434234 RepID=A0ACC0ZY19_9ROSI|nr:hypothetical protein Patl1_23985 [Pistacia atlantica]